MKVSLIAAVSLEGVIGKEQKLPWNVPEDLKYFRDVTTGAPVIMGRKTYDSIGQLLPKRKNIIVTRQKGLIIPGGWLATNIEEALKIAGDAPEIFVIGGGDIYKMALPYADRLYITEIDVHIEGDAHFPFWPQLKTGPVLLAGKSLGFRETSCNARPAIPGENIPSYRFYVFDRE